MTTQTVDGTTVMPTPSVNLLPQEIAEAAKFRRFQLAMGSVVVLAAVVVGGLYTNAHHSETAAQSDLDAAQAQKAQIAAQVDQLKSVSDTYQQVAQAKSLLAEAMGSDVRWSYYLEDLSLKVPDDVWLTSMSITPGSPSSSSTTSTGPTPPVIAPADQIATISFGGDALSHDDVAKWLTAIAGEKGWSDPYVTSITETTIGSRTVYEWQGTAAITSKALSGRYTQSGS